MSSAPTRFALLGTFALAAVAYGLFIFALLPERVVLLDDDFGYLKSIVQTFQHGRPWTNDFLEPWNASSSSLSAIAFGLTGNFYFSTYGLQAICAGVAFFGLCALLSARGFSPRLTIVLGAFTLTFPVLLCRSLEYTGMILYVPCLVAAIGAAERKRWGLFAFVWLLAAANRQSAVAWLVLPACAVGQALLVRRRGGDASLRWPLAIMIGGITVLAFLHVTMNSTDAQRMLLYQTLARFEPANARRALTAGVVAFTIAVGFSAALQTLSRRPPARRPAWRGFGLLLMLSLTLVLLLLDERYLANPDHIDIGGRSGWAYSKLLVALSLAGWIGFRFRVLLAPALCAAASVLIIALRTSIGDYYFIDAALFGFFAVVPISTEEPAPPDSSLLFISWWKPALIGGLALAGAFHLYSALYLKAVLDEARVVTSLYERALRSERVQPHELRDAPFGYSGWHLYPHAVARRTSMQIRWFSSLLEAPVKSVELATQYDDAFPRRWQHERRASPDPQLAPLAEETARIAWFWRCRYVLQRRAPPREPSPLGPEFRPILFPLNNAEWRELAAGPPVH